jgi:arabinose-5-phosphate isomerase
MTRSPRALRDDALVRDAVRMVRELRADEIPIVDGEGRPVGLLDVQDLVALKVVHD